ncbi:hypothetical protein [Micromonospora zhanjiangensis]|uniref:Uncharacterized protein n=1 Tax=Micromonospora zhanjiangensis TaxID=1522057 RepID=A0ABV8KUE6_9ACTN
MAKNRRNDELEVAVRELAKADTLAFGGVGIAGTTLPVTEAYQTVERLWPDRTDEVRDRLTWLLDKGTPAGRAYAATLLSRVDPEAGRAAWSQLRGERGEFTTFQGCVMGRAELGEYAGGQLAPDPA